MSASDTPNHQYLILVQGHIDQSWSDWFEGLTLTHEPMGYTILAGFIADQAALYRVLIKVRDMGLPLLTVNQIVRSTYEHIA